MHGMMKSKSANVVFAVCAYSFCSATMLIFNKVLMKMIPCSSVVLLVQLCFAVVAIGGGHYFFGTPKVDMPSKATMKSYGIYCVMFVLGVYCNMRALRQSNVDTVIVFRSAVPLIVSACDFLFMGRTLPSKRSLAAMLCILLGCVTFIYLDGDFKLMGWSAFTWVTLYIIFISAEMVFGKHIISEHKVSLATSVVMVNAGSFPGMALLGALSGEIFTFQTEWLTTEALMLLAISSVMGAGIGFSSWYCRFLVSPTSFSVVGVVNKALTVLINILIWDNHASAGGTLALIGCLFAGAFYEQAPKRNVKLTPQLGNKSEMASLNTKDEEFELDVEAQASNV